MTTSVFPVRVYVLYAVVTVCWALAAADVGLLLGGVWWAVSGGAAACLAGGGALAVHHRHVTASVRTAESRGYAEGISDFVLLGVALYEASVFPLVDDSVNEEEQAARRKAAYQLAADHGLPRRLRVSAAEALEVIDKTEDAETARAAVMALTRAVHGHRMKSRR